MRRFERQFRKLDAEAKAINNMIADIHKAEVMLANFKPGAVAQTQLIIKSAKALGYDKTVIKQIEAKLKIYKKNNPGTT